MLILKKLFRFFNNRLKILHTLYLYLIIWSIKTFNLTRIQKEPYGIKALLTRNDHLDYYVRNGIFDDKAIINFVTKYIKPGMNVCDVGANYGLFSILCAKLVGDTGRIYAFEPSFYNFKKMILNFELNNVENLVLPFKLGCFSLNREMSFYEHCNRYSTLSSLSEITYDVEKGKKILPHKSIISCVTLDSFFESFGMSKKIDLLKIDVEGHEYDVLEGANGLLENHHVKYLIFEISKKPLKEANKDIQTIIGKVSFYFKYIYLLTEDRGEILIEKRSLLDFDFPEFANYLATNKEINLT